MLKQNTIRKKPVDQNRTTQLELEANNNEEYELKEIRDSVIYAIKSENRSSTRAILFDFLEKLSKKNQYIETSLDSIAPLKIA